MSNTNPLTNFDCEARIVFLERLIQNKQQEIDDQKSFNRNLVKMLVQSDPDLGSKLKSGLGQVEDKLGRLEKILKRKAEAIEKKIELSMECVEEKLTDLKKQIAMLGLAAIRNHKESVPTEPNRTSLANSFPVRNETEDDFLRDKSTKTNLREKNNDSIAPTHSSRYTKLSWLLIGLIKILLCCAMAIFTVSAVIHSQTCWEEMIDDSMESFSSQAVAFLRTGLLWLYESVSRSVAWLTNKITY